MIVYFIIIGIIISFSALMVVAVKGIRKSLNKEFALRAKLKEKTDSTANLELKSVSGFVTIDEFRELEVKINRLSIELETNNRISTLQANDVLQIKSQVKLLNEQLLNQQNQLIKVGELAYAALQFDSHLHSTRSALHLGSRMYPFATNVEPYEANNDLIYDFSTQSMKKVRMGYSNKKISTSNR